MNKPFVLCSNDQNYFECIHVCDRCKGFIEIYVGMLCEPSCNHSCIVLLHILANILFGLVNPFDTNYILIFWYINPFSCLILLNAFYFFIHGLCPYFFFKSFFNFSGSYIGENNAKRKNEFGVPSSYISHKLLVFIGFVDVKLLILLDELFYDIGVLVCVS